MEQETEISETFDSRELNLKGAEALETIKKAFSALELKLEGILPNSRYASLYKTTLEESQLWASKAVSREEVYQTKGQVN